METITVKVVRNHKDKKTINTAVLDLYTIHLRKKNNAAEVSHHKT